MADLAHQARSILAVYLARGQSAVASLEAGRDDDALAYLKLRAAAFHNFRATEARAQAAGQDLTADPAAVALWREIRAVNTRLAGLLSDARDRAQEMSQRLRDARRAIGTYRSGAADTASFEKSA
jgi:hypothetical protein